MVLIRNTDYSHIGDIERLLHVLKLLQESRKIQNYFPRVILIYLAISHIIILVNWTHYIRTPVHSHRVDYNWIASCFEDFIVAKFLLSLFDFSSTFFLFYRGTYVMH